MKHGRVTQDTRKWAVDPASPPLLLHALASCLYTRLLLVTRACFLLHAFASCYMHMQHAHDMHMHMHSTCTCMHMCMHIFMWL